MVQAVTLKTQIETWWGKLNKLMQIAECWDSVDIGLCTFKPLGDKHHYHMKTKCTSTYVRTFQSITPVEKFNGDIVYPIVDVYFDICKGRKYTSYRKVRIHYIG